jgi:alkylation response protein AidB-like acyl-CoA dehydrogenase
MQLRFAPEQEEFRATAAAWLTAQMAGPFRHLAGIRNHTAAVEERREWELALGGAGWSCIGWPTYFGGHGASLADLVIFAE